MAAVALKTVAGIGAFRFHPTQKQAFAKSVQKHAVAPRVRRPYKVLVLVVANVPRTLQKARYYKLRVECVRCIKVPPEIRAVKTICRAWCDRFRTRSSNTRPQSRCRAPNYPRFWGRSYKSYWPPQKARGYAHCRFHLVVLTQSTYYNTI